MQQPYLLLRVTNHIKLVKALRSSERMKYVSPSLYQFFQVYLTTEIDVFNIISHGTNNLWESPSELLSSQKKWRKWREADGRQNVLNQIKAVQGVTLEHFPVFIICFFTTHSTPANAQGQSRNSCLPPFASVVSSWSSHLLPHLAPHFLLPLSFQQSSQ